MSKIALQHQYRIIDTDIIHVNSVFENNKDCFIKFENFETASRKYFACNSYDDLKSAIENKTNKNKYILTNIFDMPTTTNLLF
jgi:hypothetical protein